MSLAAPAILWMMLRVPTAGADTRCQVFPPGGYVGVYADSLGQDSTIVLAAHPGFWYGEFHILAVLNGAVAGGMSGAQFRVHLPLAPTGMFITTTLSPGANLSFGDPIAIGAGDGGLYVAFQSCARGYAGAGGKTVVSIAHVKMLTLEGFDTPAYVQKRAPPDFRAPCAIFSKCDAPIFTPAPMETRGTDSAGEDYVFVGRLLCAGGTVSTRASNWGAMKSLYR